MLVIENTVLVFRFTEGSATCVSSNSRSDEWTNEPANTESLGLLLCPRELTDTFVERRSFIGWAKDVQSKADQTSVTHHSAKRCTWVWLDKSPHQGYKGRRVSVKSAQCMSQGYDSRTQAEICLFILSIHSWETIPLHSESNRWGIRNLQHYLYFAMIGWSSCF